MGIQARQREGGSHRIQLTLIVVAQVCVRVRKCAEAAGAGASGGQIRGKFIKRDLAQLSLKSNAMFAPQVLHYC